MAQFSVPRCTIQYRLLKYLLFLLLLTLTVPVKSQVLIALLFGDKLNSDKLEFGLTGGPNFSSISNSSANVKSGLGLGLYFNFKLSDKWFFHPEALPKSPFGGKNLPVYPLNDQHLDSAFKDGSISRSI